MASLLKTNTNTINEILNTINNLPEAGADLPELTNEGTATDLLSGKELINSEGEKVVGTIPNNGVTNLSMDGVNTTSVAIPEGYTSGGIVALDETIDTMSAEHVDLIAQISSALEDKAIGSGGSGGVIETCTLTLTGDGKFRYLVYEDLDGVHVIDSIPNSALPYSVNVKKDSIVCFNSEYLGGNASTEGSSSLAKEHLYYSFYTGPSYYYDDYFNYVYTLHDNFTFTASEHLT